MGESGFFWLSVSGGKGPSALVDTLPGGWARWVWRRCGAVPRAPGGVRGTWPRWPVPRRARPPHTAHRRLPAPTPSVMAAGSRCALALGLHPSLRW